MNGLVNMTENLTMGELLFDPKLNILNLPGEIIMCMKQLMDPHAHWRRLAVLTEKKFPIGIQNIEMIALEIHKPNGSPTEKLLSKLSLLDMRVKDLVGYLDILKMESILLKLKQYEPVQITKQPQMNMRIEEGKKMELRVEATGFPYPRYQWFKKRETGFAELLYQNEYQLIVPNTSLSHEGTYCCRVHNGTERDNVKFTDKIQVEIIARMSDDGQINCQRKPVITHNPVSVAVVKGQSFVLTCQAEGQSPIEFKWFKNGQILPRSSGPAIKIDNVQLPDAGEYRCIACNNSGHSTSQPAYVQVQAQVQTQVQTPVQALKPHPNMSDRLEDLDLEITAHPKSSIVVIGGSALFKCEAICRLGIQPSYQWHHNGVPIPSAISQCLEIHNIQDSSEEGYYVCRVSVRIGGQERSCISSFALLNIDRSKDRPGNVPEYHPSDKVALLIGNYDYRNELPLGAPKPDVQVMGDIFRSLDFKVVSLLNLTSLEIMTAVNIFCDLLGPKVYGVFYFCGHGFEEDGNCFLVPQDPPAGYIKSDCVCAEVVQDKMQNTNANLVCLILDICRKPNNVQSTKLPDLIAGSQKGKTIVLYATSQRLNAYEDTKNGLLVHYIQPFLKQQKPIEEVFREFRAAFAHKHPNVEQIPEVKTNLKNVNISLADKISCKGDTKAFTERTFRWMKAHEKPPAIVVKIENLGIEVQLNFQSDFSNVLHVYVTVLKAGVTSKCIAYIADWPSTVSIMGPIQRLPLPPIRTKTTLQDIQKLQTNLIVTVIVQYTLEGQSVNQLDHSKKVDLGRPLVAALYFGQNTYENLTGLPHGREPQQHVEDDSSLEESQNSGSVKM